MKCKICNRGHRTDDHKYFDNLNKLTNPKVLACQGGGSEDSRGVADHNNRPSGETKFNDGTDHHECSKCGFCVECDCKCGENK